MPGPIICDPQGSMLTPHFSLAEFRCPCCGLIHRGSALHVCEMLELMRTLIGPIHILSGTRCQAYNEAEGGVRDSAHLESMAVDVRVACDAARFMMVRTAMDCGFRRIGVAKSSLHLDTRETTVPLMWTYYK